MAKPIFHAWTHNVGRMIAEEAVVTGACDKCHDSRPVDLGKIAAKHGPLYCLWNRHPPCPRRCGGRLKFTAIRPGAGAWHVILATSDPADSEPFHRAWRAERDAIKAAEVDLAWLRKRRRRRIEVRAAARDLIARSGPGAAEEAARQLYLPAQSDEALAKQAAIYREVLFRLARATEPPDLEAPL